MGRVILGAIVGFVAWSVIWIGTEKAMSAIWPDWFGAHQVAFEAAVTEGGPFIPDSTILILNIVRGSLIAIVSGFLAALVARENRHSPLILGVLLVAFDLAIMSMAKSYIPLWYPIVFAILLFPTAVVGGRLKKFV